jgi:Ca2+-binding RTX toxin-like protein
MNRRTWLGEAFGGGLALEPRNMPSATVALVCGVVTVREQAGTAEEFVLVETVGSKVDVTVGDVTTHFNRNAVRGVLFDGHLAGPDATLFLSEHVSVPVTAVGGKGDNFFDGDGSDAFLADGDLNVFSSTGGSNLFDGHKGANNQFSGGAGSDLFIGGSGLNSFSGGGGCDAFYSGSGSNLVDFNGHAVVFALQGETDVTGTGSVLIIVCDPSSITVAVAGSVCIWDV